LVKPYRDTIVSEDVFIREFDAALDSDELVWHRDEKNRHFAVLDGEDWWFQEDDKMPVEYHILLKGTEATDLKIKIWEE
jgi:hypothetical protein